MITALATVKSLFLFLVMASFFGTAAISFSKASLIPVSKGAVAGTAIEASSLWNDGPACIFVVRRPGWVLCREEAKGMFVSHYHCIAITLSYSFLLRSIFALYFSPYPWILLLPDYFPTYWTPTPFIHFQWKGFLLGLLPANFPQWNLWLWSKK